MEEKGIICYVHDNILTMSQRSLLTKSSGVTRNAWLWRCPLGHLVLKKLHISWITDHQPACWPSSNWQWKGDDENALKQERALFLPLKLLGAGKVVKAKKKDSLEEFITRSVEYSVSIWVLNWIGLNWSELLKVRGCMSETTYPWPASSHVDSKFSITCLRQLQLQKTANLQAKSLG